MNGQTIENDAFNETKKWASNLIDQISRSDNPSTVTLVQVSFYDFLSYSHVFLAVLMLAKNISGEFSVCRCKNIFKCILANNSLYDGEKYFHQHTEKFSPTYFINIHTNFCLHQYTENSLPTYNITTSVFFC